MINNDIKILHSLLACPCSFSVSCTLFFYVNCCYIGPSTGAAGLFLAGNYISSDCRHCEGKSPALFCRCFHQTTDISLKGITAGPGPIVECSDVCELCVSDARGRKKVKPEQILSNDFVWQGLFTHSLVVRCFDNHASVILPMSLVRAQDHR